MDWLREEVACLLEEYQKYHCLYSPRSPGYHKKTERLKAFNAIIHVLRNKFSKKVTVEQIKKKMRNLRTQFSAEKNKVVNSLRSGGKVHKPQVWWYEKLRFLEDSIQRPQQSTSACYSIENDWASKTMKTEENGEICLESFGLAVLETKDNLVDFENEKTDLTEHLSPDISPLSKIRKKRQVNEAEYFVSCSTNSDDQVSDPFKSVTEEPKLGDEHYHFGQLVAHKMRQLPLSKVSDMQIAILQMLDRK